MTFAKEHSTAMTPFISKKTQQHLQWYSILETLADFCQSEEGHKKAQKLDFAPTISDLTTRLAHTSEARRLLDEGNTLTFGGLYDVRSALTRASRASRLDPEDLIAIGRLLETARRTTEVLNAIPSAAALQSLAAPLFYDAELEHMLIDLFDENMELLSSASPSLRQLRGSTDALHEQLRNTLNRYLSDEDVLPMLQEDYFTLRDERYVLPLKSRHKNHIDGIVHGWSQTGSTVYVEPRRVIEANNRLMLAQAEVDAEVNRLLRDMTARVGRVAERIEESFHILVHLDLVWAMGRFSKRLNATVPMMSLDGSLNLKSFKHPLLVLSDQTVVPNSISLNRKQPSLVITGPNTGGKTVALKSVGLLTLMAHAGLHIPSQSGSTLPFVPGVFSDIGDEQSLESQHSTFSGHIANLKYIINRAAPGSVVLLDELVVGTDPGQGSALAQAITEHFVDTGCLLIVTTHYENLKVLALENDRFRNGAMGLDTSNSKPTYHLTLDLPGMSSALLTAERLGLSPSIVERASALIDPNQRKIQRQLQKLDRLQSELEAEKARLKTEEFTLNKRTAEVRKREEKLAKQRQQIKDNAHGTLLKEAQTLRDAVKAQSKQLKRTTVDRDALAAAKGTAQAAIDHVFRERKAALAQGGDIDIESLKAGQSVYVLSMQRQGRVQEVDRNRSRCRVEMGQFSMLVPFADLQTAAENQKKAPTAKRFASRQSETKQDTAVTTTPSQPNAVAPQTSQNTVDLRGQTVEEALENVIKFLDESFLRNEAGVYIIHGHGGGHLKRAIRGFLNTTEYVVDQRPGDRYEGGDGVTVVRLG